MKKFFLMAAFAIGLTACSSPTTEETRTPAPQKPSPTSGSLARNTSSPTVAVPAAEAPSPSAAALAVYDDQSAPFTIRYPRDWKIREEPESIFFQAPDESAKIQVIVYEYQEGAPKNTTAKDVFNNFAQTWSQGTGLKLGQQTTNADGSVSANVEFNDPSTRAPLSGFLRVALAKDRRHHFIVIFAANRDQFARYRSLGMAVMESFREK